MCPDSMDDVEELIMENGEVKIDSVKNPGEKAEVSGKLEFRILYPAVPAGNSRRSRAAFRLRRRYICRDFRKMIMFRRDGSWMI